MSASYNHSGVSRETTREQDGILLPFFYLTYYLRCTLTSGTPRPSFSSPGTGAVSLRKESGGRTTRSSPAWSNASDWRTPSQAHLRLPPRTLNKFDLRDVSKTFHAPVESQHLSPVHVIFLATYVHVLNWCLNRKSIKLKKRTKCGWLDKDSSKGLIGHWVEMSAAKVTMATPTSTYKW